MKMKFTKIPRSRVNKTMVEVHKTNKKTDKNINICTVDMF